jgi:tetratricopeptide (TPR) repeat protein
MGNLMNLAVYNPAILTDADFLTSFVARRDLAEGLLNRMREITPGNLAKHHLILGQRGMGKTSLLRRLALGVRNHPELAAVLLPLSFREEQYNVHNLHTFWCNCLDALGDWFEKNGQTDQADEVDKDIAALTRGEIDPEGAAALDAFKRWAKHEGRRPLLLLDNIDLILSGLDGQDWSLRRVLQEAGGIVVVGATAGYLETTSDPQAAFYDFFQVTVLERLSQDELLACLRQLAQARGEGGKKVREVIDRDPGRIRTLYDLTGGNPRTLVLLYLLLELDSGGDVLSDLERLLDQVTVLYKARVEDLAPQARVVLDALALYWNPATAADLASVCGLETPAVSAQLDRLLKAGIVEKVSISTSVRTAFQLGERFFNIWYLMRHGPRRQRTRLRWLTGFLKGFYSQQQLEQRAKDMLQRREGGDLSHCDYCLALGDAVEDSGLRLLLAQTVRKGMERYAAANGKRLEDITDPADLPTPRTAEDWDSMGWWLDVELGRYEEAEEAYRHAIELDPQFAWPWYHLGWMFENQLALYGEAKAAYRHTIELDPKFAWAWCKLGDILQKRDGNYNEAEVHYRRAIELEPENQYFWHDLGYITLYCLEKLDEAENAFQMALKLGLDDDLATTSNLLALHLTQPERQAEAEAEFEAIISRHPPHGAGLLLAIRALARNNFGEMTSALKMVMENDHPDIFDDYQGFFILSLRLADRQGYGDKLLTWLDEQGLSDRYWPLRVAFDAYLHGEARLMDVNPEVRGAAKRIFEWLDAPRRHATPAAEPPKPKKTRARRRTAA